MRFAVLAPALLVLASSAGCVSELGGSVERRCPESAVELQAEQTGLTYEACGAVDDSGCLGTETSLGCFNAAFADCAPAQLEVRHAAGAIETHLVEPDGSGGCRVVVLHDDGGDPEVEEPGVTRVFCNAPVACSRVGVVCSAPVSLCRGR